MKQKEQEEGVRRSRNKPDLLPKQSEAEDDRAEMKTQKMGAVRDLWGSWHGFCGGKPKPKHQRCCGICRPGSR